MVSYLILALLLFLLLEFFLFCAALSFSPVQLLLHRALMNMTGQVYEDTSVNR